MPVEQAELHALGVLLQAHRSVWHPRPFSCLPVDWEAEHPALATFLRKLPLEALPRLERAPWTLDDAPEPWPSWVASLRPWTRLPAPLPAVSAARPRRVKDRKWAQIMAFTGNVTREGEGPWVDWCAGKAHLGRTLAAHSGHRLLALERDPTLCLDGAAMALEHGVEARFTNVDVHHVHALPDDGHAVSLHACGQLHLHLLDLCAEGAVRSLALAPCCYHRIDGERYLPRSSIGRAEDLALDRQRLRLATMEVVVAPPRVEAVRQRSVSWRVAVDLLERQVSGRQRKLELPHLQPAWFRLPFEEFVVRTQELLGLTLPARSRWAAVLPAARERARLVRALAVPRWLFRRPLERWLVLDRALALQEAGWQVRLGRFCAREVSPRNLLIVAQRP